jgi:DNA-binding CsgD family transcriptional regulator
MDSGLIGRDGAVAEVSAFLAANSKTLAALAITGDAGIGKTAVWRHSVQAACRSSRVLACQPAPAERPLAFSALDDLFSEVADEILPALPGPRRQVMEAALLREPSPEPGSPALSEANSALPERRALARGVLDALRILSGGGPLVIAIDDAHWLDRPSASALEFCVRRLQREPVSIVLTFRAGNPVPLGLDRALAPDGLGRVRLGPLSLGAIGEILRSRLGAALPRHILTRLYDACGGNPLYALECAHALLEHPRVPRTNEPIPIPRNLTDLVRDRVRHLTPDVRRVSQMAATSSCLRERLIRVACDDMESWAAIDQAIEFRILERDGEELRFTHPLLRSVLYAEMTPKQRRLAHQRLAVSAEDIEERAWHFALGADRPSGEIAEMLDDAAAHAGLRGAPEEAAALAEQATRLTPADRAGEVRERTVRAADYHFRAGDMIRSRELVQSVLATGPAGQQSAPLLLRLATIDYHQSTWPLAEQTFRQAAAQASDDPGLRAHAEQGIAFTRVMAGDLATALQCANSALHWAERTDDPHLIADSLARIAAFEFLHGKGARPELLDKAEKLDASAVEEPAARVSLFRPAIVRGLIFKWCDQLGEARLRLAGQYQRALERGDEASLPFLLYHFSELECWAGNWNVAEQYALEGCRVAEESRQQTVLPATLYSLALVRAHLGGTQAAQELASEALALCEKTGNVPVASQALSVLGFIALSQNDYQATHSYLSRLTDAITVFGLGEPSVIKFLPDEIEALIALGEYEAAGSFTTQLQVRGKSLGRPWAQAAGARCHALLAAVGGDLQGAQAACEQALSYHERLPMPFELARTLLVQGKIERRARHRQAARDCLGRALTVFEQLGAPLWADRARRELSKITTRQSVHGLTETESRVATLVAQGLTNREIASAMFVAESTVQTHVRHIFQKVGVSSRTGLAARLLPTPANTKEALGPLDAQKGTEPASLSEPLRTRPVVNITDSGDSRASARS